MRRLIALAAACLVVTAVIASPPRFGSAQTATTGWPTFQGDAQRDGLKAVNGTTAGTAVVDFNPLTDPLAPGPNIGQGQPSSPVVDGAGNVYIGDFDSYVYAFGPGTTITPRWKFKTGGQIQSTPTLSNDGSTLFVGSNDGNVYAINTATGTQKWAVQLNGEVHASPLLSPDGSTLYVPNINGSLYALFSAAGTTKWKFAPGGSMPTSAALSPDGSTIYIGVQKFLYEVPAGTGTGAPAAFLDDTISSTPSVDSNGNVYVGTVNGILDVFSQTSVTAQWTFQVPHGGAILSSPSFISGLVVFGGANGIYAVSASTHGQAWHAPAAVASAANSSPAIASGNNMIYIGSTDGNLYALDPTGKVLFQRSTGTAIDASPAIASDGSVWASSRSGELVRLKAITPPPTIPMPSATATPVATNTPTVTPTPVATNTPTATPTPIQVPLTVSVKSKVKDGEKQTVTITSAPSTTVHIRVDYPNGDHQSASKTTDAAGKATYTFTQGSSKIKHNDFTATVTVTAGTGASQNKQTATYAIQFGAIDASAEPRKQSAGKVVDIFVHAKPGTRVAVYLLAPSGRVITLGGTTGPKGFASIKFKIPSGLAAKGAKITVLAQFKNNGKIATKTSFSIK